MLALALVFVFAESLAEIVVSPVYRAGAAVVALMGVTSMVIYRQRLLDKFRDPSGGLIAGVIGVVLLVLALSPFIEEKRWPFSVWFRADVATEAQKSTLVEWLQEARRERDEAKQDTAAAEAQKATLVEWLQTAQHEGKETKQEKPQRPAELSFPLHSPGAATAAQSASISHIV